MVFVGDAIFQKPPSDCQITFFYLLLGANKMKKSFFAQRLFFMFHRESGILI